MREHAWQHDSVQFLMSLLHKPVRLEIVPRWSNSVDGDYDRHNRIIRIPANLTESRHVAILCHELGHALEHDMHLVQRSADIAQYVTHPYGRRVYRYPDGCGVATGDVYATEVLAFGIQKTLFPCGYRLHEKEPRLALYVQEVIFDGYT